ncbi:MAG: ABC transporter permease [Gammaproteobacteria bacterium]
MNVWDIIIDTYTIWLREVMRYFKSKARIIGSLSQPLIYLIIIGIGFGAFVSGLHPDSNYLEWFSAGIIGMTVLFTSMYAGASIIWEKQFGFLKEILVAPVKRISIVLGKILGIMTTSIILSIIMLAIVIFTGIVPMADISFSGLLQVLMFIAFASAIFTSFGIIMASELSNIESFQTVINFFIMPIFFLSTSLFPIVTAPAWMQDLANLNPLTYAVDGIRGGLIGTYYFSFTTDLIGMLIFTVIFIASADMSFKKLQGK